MSTVGTRSETAADAGPRTAPAYLRIAAALRARIDDGQLQPGTALPPERELCIAYDVSRMTARRALGVLEAEGLVHRGSTRGTFVSEPRVKLRVGSFTEEIVRSGRRPAAELVWAEEQWADAAVARALDLEEGAPVHALQRLRRSNAEPLALETTAYPADRFPGLLDDDLTGSLWDRLREHYGVRPARATAELESVVLDADAAARLDARPAAGGLLFVRRTFDAGGACIEYARDIYRADRVTLVIEREFDT